MLMNFVAIYLFVC